MHLMHIYLVRHAHAHDGEDDASRPLSRKGLSQVRALGRQLRRNEAVKARVIWHSPLRRAKETAYRLVEHWQEKVKISETSGLKPGDEPSLTARRLGDLKNPVIIVGHDPHLSALASLLVTGRAEPHRFHLKKGTMLRLDRESGGWSVRWQISPEVL